MFNNLNDESNENKDTDVLEVVKNGISLKEGSIVKINPKYNYPNQNTFKILKIMTFGECRILTQKYYENREEVDKNEYYNNFVDKLIEMVEEEEPIKEIKNCIQTEINNSLDLFEEENEDEEEKYSAYSVFNEIFNYITDISQSNKSKIIRLLKNKKRKNKQYRNFSMLLERFCSSKLGFNDNDILLSIVNTSNSKNNKPIWQIAKGMILIQPDGKEIELWDKL